MVWLGDSLLIESRTGNRVYSLLDQMRCIEVVTLLSHYNASALVPKETRIKPYPSSDRVLRTLGIGRSETTLTRGQVSGENEHSSRNATGSTRTRNMRSKFR